MHHNLASEPNNNSLMGTTGWLLEASLSVSGHKLKWSCNMNRSHLIFATDMSACLCRCSIALGVQVSSITFLNVYCHHSSFSPSSLRPPPLSPQGNHIRVWLFSLKHTSLWVLETAVYCSLTSKAIASLQLCGLDRNLTHAIVYDFFLF